MRAAIAAVLFALPLLGQQDEEFDAWMKISDKAWKTFDEKKTGPPAAGAAEALGAIYENMIGFWRRHNAGDAVKWSEEGKAAAVRLAAAAHAGNTEKASAALRILETNCNACHEVYRVQRPDGSYRINWRGRARTERPR